MNTKIDLTERIAFHSEGISFVLPEEDNIRNWIANIIEAENCVLQQLNFVFCSDQYLHKINLEYLNHDTYTDIITFPYSEGKIVESDIFISVDRTTENAKTYDVEPLHDLHRVIIHGVLHLVGYGDKTAEEKTLMRQKEDEALAKLT
ncbi:MAG: rRNA maturation RNase YbeY [Aureispira sp.]|nr:rRNA maturation RNase YbeY [Aureispira sp.]